MRLVAGVALTTGFAWLFLRETDLTAAAGALAALPPWTLPAVVAVLAVAVALTALRWRLLLLAAGHRSRYRPLVTAVVAGSAVNNVLPARGGDLLRLGAVDDAPAAAVAGTLAAERLLDGLVLSVWILAGALLLGDTGPLLLAGAALSGGTLLGLLLAVLAARRPEAVDRLPYRLRAPALSFVDGLAAFRRRGPLALSVAVSAGIWTADLALYAIVGAAVGIDPGLGGYLALEGVGNLALAVPGTPAGAGSFDYLTLVAAERLAVPEERATAYVLLVHAAIVLPVSLAGAVVLHRALPRRRRRSGGEPNGGPKRVRMTEGLERGVLRDVDLEEVAAPAIAVPKDGLVASRVPQEPHDESALPALGEFVQGHAARDAAGRSALHGSALRCASTRETPRAGRRGRRARRAPRGGSR